MWFNEPADSANKSIDSFDTRSIPIDTLKGIRPMKALSSISYTIWEIAGFILAGLFFICLLLFVCVRIRRLRNLPPFPQKKANPLQRALEQLEELRASQLFKNGDFYQYHKQVSQVIRIFIYQHLQINAGYLSSEQTLQLLSTLELSSGTDNKLFSKLSLFFKQVDLVKFGGHASNLAHANELHANAVTLLQQLNELRRADSHG